MDLVQEFLETSTIHGLSHISTSKHLAVKILWACTVLASFTISIVLISNAVHSWEESPVLTSIETNNISDLEFPNVTVCPPTNTNTGLNNVLEASKKISLLPQMADDLAGDSVLLAQDEYHLDIVDKMIAYTDIRNIQNYYKGITKFSLPNTDYGTVHRFFVFTTATEGLISTPGYGQPFSPKFHNHVVYKYVFKFPENL